MTKQEWLDCEDVNKLIKLMETERKCALFGLACARKYEHLMQDQRSINCLNKFDLFIDGKIDKKEFEEARQAASQVVMHSQAYPYWVAACAASNVGVFYNYDYFTKETKIEIIKDVYNPFLLNLTFSKGVVNVAQNVYDTQDQVARFVLSDCLEEEGYPEELYLHLKSGNHYKGCWVIDQILGKP